MDDNKARYYCPQARLRAFASLADLNGCLGVNCLQARLRAFAPAKPGIRPGPLALGPDAPFSHEHASARFTFRPWPSVFQSVLKRAAAQEVVLAAQGQRPWSTPLRGKRP